MKLKQRKIDFTQWEIFGEDERNLLTLMNKVAGDIANIYLEKIEAEFPKIWAPRGDGRRGKDVADPLTIFLVDEDGDDVYACLLYTSIRRFRVMHNAKLTGGGAND